MIPMTWIPILDILAELGAATAFSLWLPLLVWTAAIIPAWMVLSYSSAPPLVQYRLRQVLLAALPVGMIATVAVDASGWLVALQEVFWSEPAGSVRVGVIPLVADSAPSTVSPTAPPIWSWTHAVGLATLVVLGGALVGIGRLIRDLGAFLGLRRSESSTPAPDLQERVDALRRQFGILRPVRVMVTERDVVPMTLGGWPATLLLPARLLDRPEPLRMTLRHELVHVQRWDDLAHFAERGVAALFSAVPLVRWLQRSIARHREQACDAAVLKDETTRPSAYAKLLVAFAGRAASGPVALSLSESPSALKQRLHAMKRRASSLSTRWTSVLALATLVAVTLGVVACSDGLAPSPPETNSQKSLLSASERAGEDPLFVVDGVVLDSMPVPAPSNVSSIEVLKGPAAAAIDAYGERGANGVVKITTKQAPISGETTPPKSSIELRTQPLQDLQTKGDPLLVVDGVVVADGTTHESLAASDLDPDDIASIEVLKGAAVTDAYGERGANGVVKITTE